MHPSYADQSRLDQEAELILLRRCLAAKNDVLNPLCIASADPNRRNATAHPAQALLGCRDHALGHRIAHPASREGAQRDLGPAGAACEVQWGQGLLLCSLHVQLDAPPSLGEEASPHQLHRGALQLRVRDWEDQEPQKSDCCLCRLRASGKARGAAYIRSNSSATRQHAA